MVLDEVTLLRLVWHPFHFGEDGELLATAFDSSDILALPDKDEQPRYISVDDIELVSQASVDWRIRWQQRDGRREALRRFDAKFVQFTAGRLRECHDTDGHLLFELTREPLAEGEDGPESPENPAHCAVRTNDPLRYSQLPEKKRKQAVMRIRTQLMKAFTDIITSNQLFPTPNT